MTAPDELFSDALFLVNHPNWTYADLQATPAAVVDLIIDIENTRARVSEAKRRAAEQG